jgi:hypothetical protein
MGRKKFSCDFETTTQLDDCRVWAYGWMEIGNIKNYKIGNRLDEFMEWMESTKADLYFHNLRFDGEFLVNYLLKAGYTWDSKANKPKTFSTLISKMGQWYMIDICYGYKGKNKLHTRIYDSLKKIPFPVKKIAKDFNLPILKGDIDYHLERPIGWEITPEEESYIKNDIEIIARALDIQFAQGLEKITAGSDSLHQFKSMIGKKGFTKLFPIFTEELDKNIRLAYRGGFTWVNDRIQGEEIGEGIVFDVNSLYPAMMYDKPLPFGEPIHFDGQYEEDRNFPLYIQHVKCSFDLKEGYIPTIQIKKSRFRDNEYLKTSNGYIVDLYVTNVDWELIQEHYIIEDLEYCSGFKFRQKTGIFKEFIDKWMYVKTTSEGAIKQLAKLILNSCYGKFATNTDVTGKIPYLKEDGSTAYKLPRDEETKEIIKETKDPIYTPMGVFITSWARHTTITTAQKCFDRILYCDTDSIHLEGTDIPDSIADIVDDKRLGYWKHEGTFKRAKFLRQKTYVEDYFAKWIDTPEGKKKKMCSPEEADTTIFEVKCAGMPDKIKEFVTFENFEIGFSSYGKLLPKHVNGGVVLVDTEFTIK